MKTRLEAYDRLQRKFSFVMELNTMSNCKIEASAKTLLQYYRDDLEESLLPQEMIHFSTLIKQQNIIASGDDSFLYTDKTTILTANAQKFRYLG